VTSDMFGLDGKVALITGGSRGLGRAMALGFAEAGADVVVASRKAANCERVAQEIRAGGRRSIAVGCHVGRWDDCDALVTRAIAEMGHLDIVVNNAGMAPVPPSLAEVNEELFDKTVGVNLKGPLRITALAGDALPCGGSIINVSSLASIHPSPHTVVYAAAKSGLNALTRAAAQEFGPKGIRVNAIVCGSFHTDSFDSSMPVESMDALAQRIPLGRIADPPEVVGTALFLASNASAYMTGALLSLDGGAG
jgi:NAD(P)-dependent dehydrogenase (short-subunit alcohol dehydrogenase family)